MKELKDKIEGDDVKIGEFQDVVDGDNLTHYEVPKIVTKTYTKGGIEAKIAELQTELTKLQAILATLSSV